MQKNKVIYISGKYRSHLGMNGVHENIQLARKYAIKYWKLGFAVICPHMNTAFLDGVDTDLMFLDGDIEILRRCDTIVMIPNWEDSGGAMAELAVAKEMGMEIIYEE